MGSDDSRGRSMARGGAAGGLIALLAAAAAAAQVAGDSPQSQAAAGHAHPGGQQMAINRRISRAALVRARELTAMLDGVPAPAPPGAVPARVPLSTAQLRIDQRQAQEALHAANNITRRLAGLPPLPRRRGSGQISATTRQLAINQRIARAALRRVGRLRPRVPTLPVPRIADPSAPGQALDRLHGVLDRNGRANFVVLGGSRPDLVGTRVSAVFTRTDQARFTPTLRRGAEISVIGRWHAGAIYGYDSAVSISDPQTPTTPG